MNRKVISFKTVLLLFLFLCLSVSVFAKKLDTDTDTGKRFYKTSALDPQRTLSNINNWSYWLYADGQAGITVTGQSGGAYPRNTDAVIFQDGFVWGAVVNGNIRVGGQTYSIGTVSQLNDRVYRIRSDWAILSLGLVRDDAAEFFEIAAESVTPAQADQIIEQYWEDWKNWPVEYGAPYVDVDEDGTYNPVLDANSMADPSKGDYPGIASADQVVFLSVDDSDNSVAKSLYSSDGIGVTLQITTWGYNQKSATLGQMMFKKYKIINTSQDTFEDMYVAQWCDPDVGDSSDDLVGCDTTLSLGYAYNGGPNDGNYDDFGIAPPAFGYDFFQGPMVPGAATDTAVFDLKKVPGFKNLPLTAFAYFSAGNQEWQDPALQEYDGTLEWYNLLRGNISKTDTDNPISFTHRDTGEETNFPLDGDPVTGEGDVDGQGANFPPADRRMSVNTGPFTMAPGDVQEVVVAVVGGWGTDYLGNITQMKNNDALAQQLYNDLFQTIPKAPPTPQVTVTPFEDKILLNWGGDLDAVSATEDTKYPDSDTTAYEFEGYNIWQLSFGLDPQQKLIGTYDLANGVTTIEQETFLNDYGTSKTVPVQFGSDNGLKRFFVIEQDYINAVNLVPGNIYYFAVTAYNYNGNPQLITDKSLESSVISIQVQTQSVTTGQKITSNAGDVLVPEHSSGTSDGEVSVSIIDPTQVTGHNYEILFHTDIDTNSSTYNEVLWGVNDATSGSMLIENQTQSLTLDISNQPIFDGIQVKVAGPLNDFKSIVTIANADGPIAEPFPTAYPYYWVDENHPLGIYHETDVSSVDGSYWFIASNNDEEDPTWAYTASRITGYSGGFGEDNMGLAYFPPRDYEIRFTATGSEALYRWPYNDTGAEFMGTVPFELWCLGDDPDDAADDYQCFIWVNDDDENGEFNILDKDHPASGSTNDPYTDSFYSLEPLSRDQAGYDALVAAHVADPLGASGEVLWAYKTDYAPWNCVAGLMRVVFVSWNGGEVSGGVYTSDMPEEGTIIKMITTKPNSAADEFTFTAPAVEKSVALEKEAVKKANVFPNPYYGGNDQETTILGKFVTFSHLSNKAEIRIFNLAGDHVVKLEKDDESPFLRWDLRNANQLPVASGIYFAHLKMTLSDGSKVTKNLKVFVIQRQQQLKYF